jgi:prepilin-type N-terminal cleavage/methylation domain-containing protein
MSKNIGNKSGVSLIELVMVMVIVSIIAFIIGDSLRIGISAYFTAEDRTEAIEKGRVALERIERETRNAVMIDNSSAGAAQLCFNDMYARTVSFRYTGTEVTREEWPADITLCPDGGGAGGESVLVGDISPFSFYFVNGSGPQATPDGTTKRILVNATSVSGVESVDLQTQAYPVNVW